MIVKKREAIKKIEIQDTYKRIWDDQALYIQPRFQSYAAARTWMQLKNSVLYYIFYTSIQVFKS